MRVEANKFMVSNTKILVGATKFFWSAQSNLVVMTKKLLMLKKNVVAPTKILLVLTKNEGQPDKNFGQPNQIAIWLPQPSQKVGSAYKISMSINFRVYISN